MQQKEEPACICVWDAAEEVEAAEDALAVLFQVPHGDAICSLQSCLKPVTGRFRILRNAPQYDHRTNGRERALKTYILYDLLYSPPSGTTMWTLFPLSALICRAWHRSSETEKLEQTGKH